MAYFQKKNDLGPLTTEGQKVRREGHQGLGWGQESLSAGVIVQGIEGECQALSREDTMVRREDAYCGAVFRSRTGM